MNEKRLPPRLMVLLVVLKGEKVETYCRESDAFEQYVIEFINSHWDEHHPLKELNPNHHYMSNSYGDTIQVHFNDESLFIIITMTGQY